MSKKRNSVLWNIKDILASNRVSQMTLEQEGAYRRALDIFYLNGGLPSDPELLAKAIGKGCTIEVAKVVKSMFKEDREYLNRLTHDYVDKLPEGFDGEMYVLYEADDSAKQMFIKCCEMLKTDDFIRRASPNTMGLDPQHFEKIVEEFMLYKLATGQFKSYKDTSDIRRNLINFIPYSRHLKSLQQDGRPYANPKSATSKFERW